MGSIFQKTDKVILVVSNIVSTIKNEEFEVDIVYYYKSKIQASDEQSLSKK